MQLADRAQHIAALRLADTAGLRRAEWVAEAVAMILEPGDLGVDPDLTLAAAWVSAAIGARDWLDPGDGFGVDEVLRVLGEPVARVVSWAFPSEWQDRDEHLHDLVEAGPVEARIIVAGWLLVDLVEAEAAFTAVQEERLLRLVLSVPGLAARAWWSGWPRGTAEALA